MNAVFLQSEIQDPYIVYEKKLLDKPVWHDGANKIWAAYSFEVCKAILNSGSVRVPAINHYDDDLNEYALLLRRHLTRLGNGSRHDIARQTALLLFEQLKQISVAGSLKKLIPGKKAECDWVNSICKKLPVYLISKGFGFSPAHCEFIGDQIESLTKIMLPCKTKELVTTINNISKDFVNLAGNHILTTGMYSSVIKPVSEKYRLGTDDALSFAISNLAGLFIQSYDAGRGILSNSLLQFFYQYNMNMTGAAAKISWEKLVTETLRFDPPVQNTRRIATDDLLLEDKLIRKGESILVVLAAANRDPLKFEHPGLFDIERPNNHEHLTFGSGGHSCIANYFSTTLAAKALSCLFEQFPGATLPRQQISYEPLVNARLPKQILISLT